MLLIAALGALLLPVILLAVLLAAQPDVPAQLSAWPSLSFLYLQLLRAAVKGKKPPTELKGKPIKVRSSAQQQCDQRYNSQLALSFHDCLRAAFRSMESSRGAAGAI
jgi:hypothetical protein